MVTAVIVTNLLISLLCWYSVKRIWILRRRFATVARAVEKYERNTHRVLSGAPSAILKGQTGTASLRKQTQRLEVQVQRLQQILSLLSLGRLTWRRSVLSKPDRQARNR